MTTNQSTAFFKTLHDEKLHRLEHPAVDTIVYRTVFRILSFFGALFIPVLGICMYVIYRDDKPRYAMYPLMGTLLSIVFIAIFTTILIISQAYEFNGIPALQQLLPEWANDFWIPFPRNLPEYTF